MLRDHEKTKVGGVTSGPNPKFSVCAVNSPPFIVYVTSAQVTGNGRLVGQHDSAGPLAIVFMKLSPPKAKQFVNADSAQV
jgi:hypothetical protein